MFEFKLDSGIKKSYRDYWDNEKIEYLYLLKFLMKENIKNTRTLEEYNELYKDDEYYPIGQLIEEILMLLYGISYLYETDENDNDMTIIEINNDIIKEYNKSANDIINKYGSEYLSKHINYIAKKNWINCINSYCYDYNYEYDINNILSKIKIILYPEFDLYFNLFLSIYDLMEALKEVIKKMKIEIDEKYELAKCS